MTALRALGRSGHRLAAHCGVEAAICVVAQAAGVEPAQLRAPVDPNAVKYGDPHAQILNGARHVAIYLAVCRFGLSLRAAGASIGMSGEGVRKAIAAVEERREDPRYDRRLDELELELMGAA